MVDVVLLYWADSYSTISELMPVEEWAMILLKLSIDDRYRLIIGQ